MSMFVLAHRLRRTGLSNSLLSGQIVNSRGVMSNLAGLPILAYLYCGLSTRTWELRELRDCEAVHNVVLSTPTQQNSPPQGSLARSLSLQVHGLRLQLDTSPGRCSSIRPTNQLGKQRSCESLDQHSLSSSASPQASTIG